MVRVSGPLFSQDASGTLGGAITFSKWKGRNLVRSHAVPSNPRSTLQIATRAAMSFLSQAWANLSTADKALWESLAAASSVSTFNAYVKANMKRFTQFDGFKTVPSPSASTAASLGTLTPTDGIKQISWSQAVSTANDMWGVVVCLSETSGFTPARDNVVQAKYGTSSPVGGVVTNLKAGTYYMRTAALMEDGTIGTFLSESSAITVTNS